MRAMDAKRLAAELRPKIRASMADVRAGLERLARIPSMSASGYDAAPVKESARITAELFTAAGVGARVLEREGAHPAVVGRVDGPKGTPTVLLYAHHDVQPPGPRDRWTTDPFTPTERGGRLYGRGVADDKAGLASHLAALRAYGGKAPCGVALFIAGEEASGSTHLMDFLGAEKDTLRCGEASNTLRPVATARLPMRVPPGQDAKAAQDARVKHLESHAPWGAELKITRGPTGEAFTGATTGPAYAALKDALGAAWGKEAIDIGQGGSIPFLFDFARTFPGAALLVTGVEDPESNAHSENESLHLAECANVCVAEATFLGLLGATGRS